MKKQNDYLVAVMAAAGIAGAVQAELIDFEGGFQHGSVVTSVTSVSDSGLTVGVSALNPNRSHDLAAIFDSTQSGTRDSDLQDPWTTGNLAPNTLLGNILIIAENDLDQNNDGILDVPDDEGGRPAGSLSLDFGVDLNEFAIDLIDVENTALERGSIEFFDDGISVGSLMFWEIAATDSSVVFGNNSANRLPTITANDIGSLFDTVTVHIGGSGAIDNIQFATAAVPAPGAAVVLLAGFVGGRRRRRR